MYALTILSSIHGLEVFVKFSGNILSCLKQIRGKWGRGLSRFTFRNHRHPSLEKKRINVLIIVSREP